jgi:hypothetical protein
MFIRNDKISEIVNDSDSGVVILVSLKTRCYQIVSITVSQRKQNKYKVNSPIGSSSRSEEQEVFQPEPDTSWKRTHRALLRDMQFMF